jgi:hypothetical protein
MSLSVREYVNFLAPDLIGRKKRDIRCPPWPGDVFAICASLVYRSGIVRGVGMTFLRESCAQRNERIDQIHRRAKDWRLHAGRGEVDPHVQELWNTAIVGAVDQQVSELGCFDRQGPQDCPAICAALVELCALADETFAGVGIVLDRQYQVNDDPNGDLPEDQLAEFDFWRITNNLLNGVADEQQNGSLGATLCTALSAKRLRVLPKAQPPTKGLSIRSLTTYISLCPSIDVPVSWYQSRRSLVASDRKCNLLLLPWPLIVKPSQFHDCQLDPANDRVGWFGFEPECDWHAPVNKVKDLLATARDEVGEVDIVVLPELALTSQQHAELVSFLSAQKITLVSGVTEEGNEGVGKNYAAISFPGEEVWDTETTIVQHKHHRWKLDSGQIESYRLTTQLNPQIDWWEAIGVDDRTLNFFVLRDWLCSCVLICEDLARLDPAGQFVRAVAPDLVIALLFDGPQLPTRWPAYHATVLADDPGSSVLTLSSLGMTTLSSPRNIAHPETHSNVVGMWRDPRKGHVEIRLPPGKEAALLTINRCQATCETADGRTNSQVEGSPEFGGLYYL